MDPLTLASTLATLVQLVGMFKQERKEAKDADEAKFIEWLEYHRHEEVKRTILDSLTLQGEVATLLRQDNVLVLRKLDAINSALATLLSQVQPFKGVAKALVPAAELSDQAVHVLRQLVESGSRNLIHGELPQGAILQPEDGEPFTFMDSRFLSDDMDVLVKCGLLTNRSSSSLTTTYGLTRAGATFIRTLDLSATAPPSGNSLPPQ